MPVKNKPLHPGDFPVQSEEEKVVTRDGKNVATTPNPTVAEDIAERINEGEFKRREDDWTL
jgi:hypothetical protein